MTMKTIIHNIGTLAGILPADVRRLEGPQMNHVECIDDAYLVIEDGVITDFGPDGGRWECGNRATPLAAGGGVVSTSPSAASAHETEYIDAKGGFVMPAFCDSHTHIVYAGCRDGEFRDKIAGLSYEEIAARGGGILNSADLLHSTSEDELYRQSMERVNDIMAMGTGVLMMRPLFTK